MLGSLVRLDTTDVGAWEVVVVDNNSTDVTRETVEAFRAESGLPIRYVMERRQGLSHARNRGIAEAEGPIVAFLDDDVLVDDQWLRRMVAAFADPSVGAVGGRVFLDGTSPKPAWWVAGAYDGKVGAFDRGDESYAMPEDGAGMIGIGANLAFRREALTAAGSFRPELGRTKERLNMGDDLDMVRRVRKAGWNAVYDPAVRIVHCPAADRFTRAYLRRYMYQIGRWEADLGRERFQAHAGIAGVPRWLLRRAGGEAARMVGATVRFDPRGRTFEFLRLVRSAGTIRRCLEGAEAVDAEEAGVDRRDPPRPARKLDMEHRAPE